MPSDAKNWTADQLHFQAWLALPKKLRRPKTQRAFAKQIGKDEGTLSDWKHLPGWHDAVRDLALELLKESIPDVLGEVVAAAKSADGSVQDRKLFLEIVEIYRPGLDVTSGGKVLQGPTVYLPARESDGSSSAGS